ncbi:unnamed protein product [Clonostachys rosea]|uniref:Uncharacterized protein n=1 Tax=Bionectria ochroleuca TaxID=29856 RepID=A0ABY6TRP6_BIOOC|nr:unnamed protein product [Clonostachys rosea]
MFSNSHSRSQKRPPKSSVFVLPGDDDIQLENDDRVRHVVQQGIHRVLPFPLEIREMIYRNLVLSNKPIAVFDGWKRVYKHGNTRQTGPAFTDRPSLDINILGVNKSTYPEAARILYSENTFLYRLRDPPNICPPPINLDALVASDSASSSTTGSLEGDDPNDGDYEEYNAQSSTRRARSRRKKKELDEPCINVGKYYHLFRHIIIEAEHNRYGDDTLRSMREALEILNSPPPVDKDSVPLYPSITTSDISKKKQKSGRKAKRKIRQEEAHTPTIITPNIMSLVIKVRPSLLPNGFTFVNFFEKGSPILQAIQNLRPQQLYVKVMMGQLTNRRNGVSLSINFRHQRIACQVADGEPDMWARDREMIVRRKRKSLESLRKLGDLSSDMQKSCHRYCIHHSDVIEENDDFDFSWDEIEDDEFDFPEQAFTEAEVQAVPQAGEAQEEVQFEVQEVDTVPVPGSGWIEETEAQGEAVLETQPGEGEEELQSEVQVETVPVPGTGWIEEVETQGGVGIDIPTGETQEESQPEVQHESVPGPGGEWIEESEAHGEEVTETQAEETQEE